MSPDARSAHNRIAGIDGLRAIAVVLVLVYHLLPGALPGGNVGVDAFFVISGFLITTLLVAELRRTGRIALRRFWYRRLRRIVPALLVAMVTTVSIAGLLGGDVLLGVRRQVLSAATLVYNWVEIAAGSSYFDQTQPLLLTNVWSLAVEEQFYIVWPLVIITVLTGALRRRRTRLAGLLALALAVGSLGWTLWLGDYGASPSRLYMGTDTHAFGLMLGAALALWHGRAADGAKVPGVGTIQWLARTIAAWVGLGGLLVCARVGAEGLTRVDPARATTTLLALGSVATALVLQGLTPEMTRGARRGHWLVALLDLPPMRWLGLRSYGLYLWHWPLWVLAFYGLPPTVGGRPVAAGVMVITVAAAEASYRFLETPIRRQGMLAWLRSVVGVGLRARATAACGVTSALLLMAFALSVQPTVSSAQAAIEAGQQALSAAAVQSSAPSPTPGDAPAAPEPGSAQEAPPAPEPVTGDQVAIAGDSVSLASAAPLGEILPGAVIDAEVSRSMYAGLATVQALDAQVGARPYVVVAMATNGTVDTAQLQEILDYLGPDRRLVLVTGFGPERATWIPPANQTVRDFAAANPDRVAVAGWDEAIGGHPEMLAEDLIHPSGEGGAVYADIVYQALQSLVR
ncbi:acyltransferase family protein [Actinomyces oricola]|uniref:acyltransferase family protein n=1 Tax=Actinomyces oricola TaxID=206043 RepID=UPI000FFF3539|nr:acyltransferase family protein [Actinomyces oricola]